MAIIAANSEIGPRLDRAADVAAVAGRDRVRRRLGEQELRGQPLRAAGEDIQVGHADP